MKNLFFYPDNFVLFLVGFSISLGLAVYLLFSYHRSRLLWCNISMFFLCAFRFSTEYYIHQIQDFKSAQYLARFHSISVFLVVVLIWICTYAYIKPFEKSKFKIVMDKLYFILFVGIPAIISTHALLFRKVHEFHPTQINGYWQFKALDNWQASFHFFHSYIFMGIIIVSIFIFSIIESKDFYKSKIFFVFFFIAFPIYYASVNDFSSNSDWTIPSSATPLLVQSIIVTWLVSDYRIFKNPFEGMTKDLFNSVSDVVFITDKHEHIIFNNANFVKYFGDYVDKNIYDFFAAQSNKSRPELIKSLSNKGKGEILISLIDIDTNQKHFKMTDAPFKKSEKNLGQTYLLSDLTESIENNNKLVESNAVKDMLFAVIGHDLRKPAIGFRNITQKINYLIKQKDYEQLNRLGENIEQSAQVMNNLLDDLLYWSLLHNNHVPILPMSVSVYEIISNIEALFRYRLETKLIQFENNCNMLHTIFADRNMCMTIFRNLVDNAIKHTPNGGTIKINSAKLETNWTLVYVIDNGVGMNPDKLNLLKNPDSSSSNNFGMGLQFVKKLLSKNNGKMQIKSKISNGTTIEIKLPTQE